MDFIVSLIEVVVWLVRVNGLWNRVYGRLGRLYSQYDEVMVGLNLDTGRLNRLYSRFDRGHGGAGLSYWSVVSSLWSVGSTL